VRRRKLVNKQKSNTKENQSFAFRFLGRLNQISLFETIGKRKWRNGNHLKASTEADYK